MSFNSLHTPLRPAQITNYSSLTGGNDYSSPPLRNEQGNRSYIIVPTAHTQPSPGRYSPWQKIHIPFEYMSFCDIRLGNMKTMKNATCPVLPDGCPLTIDFRIIWPGYAFKYSTRIKTSKKGDKVTKWDLAVQVHRAFEYFVEQALRSPCTDDYWRIKESFSCDRLCLVSLGNEDGHDAVWQAKVAIMP